MLAPVWAIVPRPGLGPVLVGPRLCLDPDLGWDPGLAWTHVGQQQHMQDLQPFVHPEPSKVVFLFYGPFFNYAYTHIYIYIFRYTIS